MQRRPLSDLLGHGAMRADASFGWRGHVSMYRSIRFSLVACRSSSAALLADTGPGDAHF